MPSLSAHNSNNGETLIYSKYTEDTIFEGKGLSFEEYRRMEEIIRKVERISYKAGLLKALSLSECAILDEDHKIDE